MKARQEESTKASVSGHQKASDRCLGRVAASRDLSRDSHGDEPAPDVRTDREINGDAPTKLSRTHAAKDAGLSRDQRITATRVAAIPQQEFEEAAESDNPPPAKDRAAFGPSLPLTVGASATSADKRAVASSGGLFAKPPRSLRVGRAPPKIKRVTHRSRQDRRAVPELSGQPLKTILWRERQYGSIKDPFLFQKVIRESEASFRIVIKAIDEGTEQIANPRIAATATLCRC